MVKITTLREEKITNLLHEVKYWPLLGDALKDIKNVIETEEVKLTFNLVINCKIMPNLMYKLGQDINLNDKIEEVDR
jgi:hypothetical protein